MTTPEILQANERYAANFDKPDFSHFKNVIILACIEPRIDPYTQLGLKVGDAIIIRNAGGVAEDAIRSIVVAQHFVGVRREIMLFRHTDCGLSRVTTEGVRDLVKKENPGRDDVAKIVDAMDFHHIIDPVESVKQDVKILSENPLVIKGTKISGWLYDVDTGKISQILQAIA
ncbi:carbonic anhydrase [Mycena alexandri]|uniref:Carbonic anhydrase n=1 Tax=Mycena alexandri TaxID=1745969 RepID=A0AAD6TAS7_9AGAR|nr:carbonic anhydrase [Mycena alexandri]